MWKVSEEAELFTVLVPFLWEVCNKPETSFYYPVCFSFCFFWKIHESDTEEEEDDTIHMGNAIMTFYAALIDLLGRCAPEMHVSAVGSKNKNPGLFLFVKTSITCKNHKSIQNHQSSCSIKNNCCSLIVEQVFV